jgi:hypothetical protein
MKRDELLRREYYKGHCEGTNLGWNKAEEAMMRVFTEKLRQKKIILKPEVETIEMMMHVVSSLLQRRYLEKYDANESVIDTITIRWKEIGIEE